MCGTRSRDIEVCACVVYIKCVLVTKCKTNFFILRETCVCVTFSKNNSHFFLYFSLSHINILMYTSLVTYNFYLNNTDGFFSLICSNASFVEYGVRVTGSR